MEEGFLQLVEGVQLVLVTNFALSDEQGMTAAFIMRDCHSTATPSVLTAPRHSGYILHCVIPRLLLQVIPV